MLQQDQPIGQVAGLRGGRPNGSGNQLEALTREPNAPKQTAGRAGKYIRFKSKY